MIGNYEFGFELEKTEDDLLSISMYIDNKNIMEYTYQNSKRTTTWEKIGIIDFFIKNLHNIMKEDKYPYGDDEIIGIEFTRNSNPPINWDKFEADDQDEMQKAEEYASKLDSWVQKHNWMYYNEGAYIPDVTFRNKNNKIEISWNNNDLFEDNDISYTSKEGCIYIDPNTFETIIKDLIMTYKKMTI